ncbi:hypothetical protein SSP24_13650 [Streptomyces spinoverrucosus]|uniref:Uncharacterized protein n=1 Tax=Streptomyces spinoverrucosus TaxID=284043 RepID=A0A4Y3VD26_9ACTN|nr:hypothetical protein SSP24_13650 [Streptomyces spinoverrucosus]GHB50726.1 hypothetical protein GCM10010397_21020 [Streptomyces spinoverrucosus]
MEPPLTTQTLGSMAGPVLVIESAEAIFAQRLQSLHHLLVNL